MGVPSVGEKRRLVRVDPLVEVGIESAPRVALALYMGEDNAYTVYG